MASKVSVQDVGSLESFSSQLKSLKDEIESLSSRLAAMAQELGGKASEMNSATQGQSGNWNDPQYEQLKGQIEPIVSAVNSTTDSVEDMANVINNQMCQVEESIAYIDGYCAKLNDM